MSQNAAVKKARIISKEFVTIMQSFICLTQKSQINERFAEASNVPFKAQNFEDGFPP